VKHLSFCASFIFSSFLASLSTSFTDSVVGVLEGDFSKSCTTNTLNVSVSVESTVLRKAKQAASQLVFGEEVTLETHGKDKYGRTIADVLLPDGTNVNHSLVNDGWCWWYRKYAPGDTVLEALEKEAGEAKKGVWADPQPVPPWVYTNARRG
jgi:hypothetical protein